MDLGTDASGDSRESSLDAHQLGGLLEGYRPRLRRMVALRLDPRLRRRVDSSDVIQAAFVDVTRRLEEYRSTPKMPFFLWVRLLTAQKLLEFHRRHLGAEKRDVRREVSAPSPHEASSVSLAQAIVDKGTSPLGALLRKEQAQHLRDALERMKGIDREILMLRHFERLSNEECAQVLGLSLSGAKLRHLRATKRLRKILRTISDMPEDLLER